MSLASNRPSHQTIVFLVNKQFAGPQSTVELGWIHHTLSISLGIQFRQRYDQIKDGKQTKVVNIFGFGGP